MIPLSACFLSPVTKQNLLQTSLRKPKRISRRKQLKLLLPEPADLIPTHQTVSKTASRMNSTTLNSTHPFQLSSLLPHPRRQKLPSLLRCLKHLSRSSLPMSRSSLRTAAHSISLHLHLRHPNRRRNHFPSSMRSTVRQILPSLPTISSSIPATVLISQHPNTTRRQVRSYMRKNPSSPRQLTSIFQRSKSPQHLQLLLSLQHPLLPQSL